MAQSIVARSNTAKRTSTPEFIANALRDRILGGGLEGGAQLKQTNIANEYGVSVVPVREAFQRLVSDGLATLSPNRGVTVTPLSQHDFMDIAELRALLEPQALRLSAANLTGNDFFAAETALRDAAATPDPAERARLHWDFHRILYSKADRPRLLAQIQSLHVSITRYLLPLWARVGLSNDWADSHLIIIEALRRGDIEGATTLVHDQIIEASDRVHTEQTIHTIQGE